MITEWRAADDPQVIALTAAQQAELAVMAPHPDTVVFPLKGDIEFVVGLTDGVPVACGALQRLDQCQAENQEDVRATGDAPVRPGPRDNHRH